MWRLMEHGAAEPLRGLRTAIGFATSLLAVWCQIVLLATISLTSPAIVAEQLGGLPICHAGADDPGRPAQRAPVHDTHDCVLCAICIAHVLPAAIASPPELPVRHTVAGVRFNPAQPRAPPVRQVAAAQPRGPPLLI